MEPTEPTEKTVLADGLALLVQMESTELMEPPDRWELLDLLDQWAPEAGLAPLVPLE